MLAGDERRAPGGTRLLRVIIREQRAFLGDTVDVRRRAAHHAAMVGADIPDANIVGHDNEDIGLLLLCDCWRACRHHSENRSHKADQNSYHAHRRIPSGRLREEETPLVVFIRASAGRRM
jgi:hypothetical protein